MIKSYKCIAVVIVIAILGMAGCERRVETKDVASSLSLQEKLCSLINKVPGTVGVAYVSGHDTVTINNGVHFPMMSVFKLHEALAVANTLEMQGRGMDSLISIGAEELDPDTWSPMVREHGIKDMSRSIKELIRYALISSDNNASNLLFNHVVSPSRTDQYIKSVAPDTSFSIKYTEKEMKTVHDLAYENYSSPLAAALLIRKFFTEEVLSDENAGIIQEALTQVTTGSDRLGEAISHSVEGEKFLFAHKTGSGYRNDRGELAAHNDIGYFRRLSDNADYSVAVMIRDYLGSEEEASEVIASISKLIYIHFQETEAKKGE